MWSWTYRVCEAISWLLDQLACWLVVLQLVTLAPGLAHLGLATCLMCLGGPTFMVLKFLSHSFPLALLSSSLSLLSLGFLAPLFSIIFWFPLPLPPIWQDNFCV